MKIGYARVSTAQQDLSSQLDALKGLGVDEKNIHVDHGLTGTNRTRPGLEKALAAVRSGDEFVVTKLDRLARSIRDAKDIADELAVEGVTLRLGNSAYDPTDAMGKMMFNMLATFAEFEADLIKMRTREGMQVAKAKGKLRGKKPKLSVVQEKHLVQLYRSGEHTTGELAELFSVARSTVYRAVDRAGSGKNA
ncbi:MAG: recombinase family protein [Yaniella sp.]|uniref:recombinase family protein n=1 Tax=Yaniella sp. TaxID=2773929 RepID=UPI002649EB53|nr:recombinase family protein [Yaniella sp.]MDN6147770.1 recombinase family protein [Yaniella sp.]MDN6458168.1 recombinase family protein [Bifidobacterium crudilactis]MDN6527801.1 recombinase family protein [Brevibacterium sp.]MDN6757755.1 recombinase family protein [Yaniella sp.]